MNWMEFLNDRRTRAASDADAGASGETPPSDPPADPGAGDPPADPPAAPDLSFVPEEFRSDDGVDTAGFQMYLDDLKATKSQVDERLADVPEDASGYEFSLPEDLEFGEDLDLPEDFSVEIKADDPDMKPLLGELGNLLHQNGIPKSVAPQFMGLLAKYEAARYSRDWQTQQSEMQALGENADARVTRVQRAIENKLPKEMATALMGMTKSAAAVRALETLLTPKTMNGGGGDPPPKPERNPLAERYPSMFK